MTEKNYKEKKSKEKNFRAKKSLGQNFLKSAPALRKIIEAGEIKKGDLILEIGPGRGALTEKLLEAGGTVMAVEKDRELLAHLEEKFAGDIASGMFVLVHGDILEFNISETLSKLDKKNYKIIANIPYNITGAILKKFLTEKHQPERMVLMVQHEVAQRIVGREKESILSISVKAYGEPSMIMKVPARYFSPSPKVDSAVIAIKAISRKNFKENKVEEVRFWEIVKKGFAHKRKKLSGNLRGVINPSKFASNSGNYLGDKRAEDLPLADWISLSRN